ncbi:Gfo/Idh/MocA family oxidoreductase [Yoonia sp.]|uniref:Gfo/Idh/MocA family protein n=1 Tax=Yoonia sp. TaxID=2212373 RepID=UPI00239B5DBF|nr:Gfo/Idh/MocA family oxidoreductase [Yoonia sp.]MDE0850077.1 Gfo/Idh/MocA family oxidoreductase [Yoonia sp.]
MTFRVACLGAGFFSQFHHDGWRRLQDAQLIGVADHDLGKATATGHPAFNDLQQMLETTQPDILDVIVPPTAHADAISVAVKFDLKLIICQKPFCTSLTEARAMTALAKANGIRLIVHENFRFQPWFRTIKLAIQDGVIGEPMQATFRLRPGDGQGPNAYLERQPYFQTMPRFMIHETGVHYVDTFRFLFGNPTALYADLRKVNKVIAGEDAGLVTFDHPGGVRSLLDGNRNLDHGAANTRCTMGEGLFEGTHGTLTLLGDGSVQFRRFGSLIQKEILLPDKSGTFGGDCTFRLQEHAINALLGNGTLENEAEDYLNVIQIENAIYDSAKIMSKVKLNNYA